MDFPEERATQSGEDDLILLQKILKCDLSWCGKSKFDYLVEVRSEIEVRDLQPDFEKLKSLPARAIIVTSVAETEEYDFVSRCFALSRRYFFKCKKKRKKSCKKTFFFCPRQVHKNIDNLSQDLKQIVKLYPFISSSFLSRALSGVSHRTFLKTMQKTEKINIRIIFFSIQDKSG